MHWLNPVVSAGAWSLYGSRRAAFNIMSFMHTGVDYVAGLPDSYFPDKVIMWWDPSDSTVKSGYYHEGITIGGQVYDLIKVSGYGDNPDEWDEDVFLHEYGHFVMDNYAALPPVGPECEGHEWHEPSGHECAYAEGWATFFSCACQNDSVYVDTEDDGTPHVVNVELPSYDPQGANVEGAVCASLWDVFDYNNDSTVVIDTTWYHNNDRNAGLWWQGVNLIWRTLRQPGDLGHYPYTISDFTYIWAWSGYPTDEVWQNIFNAHGIECTPVGVWDELASMGSTRPFLWPNYPNPFNPLTQIAFRIVTPEVVSLRVFNTSGQVVRTLLDSHKDAGTYTVSWDGKDDSGRDLASGVYFCQFIAGAFRQTRKLVVLR